MSFLMGDILASKFYVVHATSPPAGHCSSVTTNQFTDEDCVCVCDIN